MNLEIYVLALKGGVPETGLTLADFSVDIFRVKKSDKSVTQVVTAAAMQFEVTGSGKYGYFYADPDYTAYTYHIQVTYTGAVILDATLWVGDGDAFVSSRTTLGAGAIEWTYTLTSSVDGAPIPDADVWVSTDNLGANVIASGRTNALGVVTFYLDAGNVYIWRQKSGWNFVNPDLEVVS